MTGFLVPLSEILAEDTRWPRRGFPVDWISLESYRCLLCEDTPCRCAREDERSTLL